MSNEKMKKESEKKMSKEKWNIGDDEKVNIDIRLGDLGQLERSGDVLERLIDYNKWIFEEESKQEKKDYGHISCVTGDLNDLFVIRDFVDSISEKKETFIKKRSLEIKESVN